MRFDRSDRGSGQSKFVAIIGLLTAVVGLATSPIWAPSICDAVGVCSASPQPSRDGSDDGPKTQPQHSSPPAQTVLNSVSRSAPGCDEKDSKVVWTTVKGDLSCSSGRATLKKRVGWDDGFLKSYAELHMSIKGQQFPSSYTVSFTIGGLSGPELDRNRGGCGGLAVHTSTDGNTYDYFNVCGDGWVEAIRAVGNSGVDNQTRQITPGPKQGTSASYNVVVTVSTSTVKVTVSNRVGQSVTISSPAVGSTTAYLSLITTWRNVGATAAFSDFTYSAG